MKENKEATMKDENKLGMFLFSSFFKSCNLP